MPISLLFMYEAAFLNLRKPDFACGPKHTLFEVPLNKVCLKLNAGCLPKLAMSIIRHRRQFQLPDFLFFIPLEVIDVLFWDLSSYWLGGNRIHT